MKPNSSSAKPNSATAKPNSVSPWMPIRHAEGPNALPGTLNTADIVALQMVAAGEANPDQQKRAIRAIVVQIAQANDLSYRPDGMGGERDTAFAEGKRYVGLAIRKAVEVPLDVWTGKKGA